MNDRVAQYLRHPSTDVDELTTDDFVGYFRTEWIELLKSKGLLSTEFEDLPAEWVIRAGAGILGIDADEYRSRVVFRFFPEDTEMPPADRTTYALFTEFMEKVSLPMYGTDNYASGGWEKHVHFDWRAWSYYAEGGATLARNLAFNEIRHAYVNGTKLRLAKVGETEYVPQPSGRETAMADELEPNPFETHIFKSGLVNYFKPELIFTRKR